MTPHDYRNLWEDVTKLVELAAGSDGPGADAREELLLIAMRSDRAEASNDDQSFLYDIGEIDIAARWVKDLSGGVDIAPPGPNPTWVRLFPTLVEIANGKLGYIPGATGRERRAVALDELVRMAALADDDATQDKETAR